MTKPRAFVSGVSPFLAVVLASCSELATSPRIRLPNGPVKSVDNAPVITDWWTCASYDGGQTWNCEFDKSDTTGGDCGTPTRRGTRLTIVASIDPLIAMKPSARGRTMGQQATFFE